MPPSPTIVVVDDDEEIRDLLGEHLRRAGFGVAALADGRGLDEALLRQAAVVILDVMLPGEDGFSLCRRIRSRLDVPIIMLTASSDEADRVIGLELGADDPTITWPSRSRRASWSPASRRCCAAAAGRPHRNETFILAAGTSIWSATSCTMTMAARWRCPALSSPCLTCLSASPSRSSIATRSARLCMAAMPCPLTAIDVQVSHLRQRLGDDQALIRTVRGRGYLLAADVRHES